MRKIERHWAWTILGVVSGVFYVVAIHLLSGCGGSFRNASVDVVNATTDLLATSEHALAKLDEFDQQACEKSATKEVATSCIQNVRAKYATAWNAYRKAFAARLAAAGALDAYDAAVKEGKTPNQANLQTVMNALSDALTELQNAVLALQGSKL